MTFRIIPMSSSHLPDIWNTSELDHGIPPSLLEDINQHSDDSMLQDSIFDVYGEPHHRDIQTLNSLFCDLPSLPPGEPITHAHMHDSNPTENIVNHYLLSGVPPRHLQTSDWTYQKGRITHKI